MEPTVDDIYSSLEKSKEYSGNIKKSGNQISVYLNISINKRGNRIAKIQEIKEYLKTNNPSIKNTIVYNTNGSGSSIGRIEIVRKSQNDIVVFLKPIDKLSINKHWLLNEEMFSEIAMEYYSYAKEDRSKFNIKLTDGIKVITFNDVKSVTRVGGANKKPDIIISKNSGKDYYISIKLPDFRTWQTSANSNQLAKDGATKVLNNISNIAGAFSKPNSKISVKSTENEVIEFCFGGRTVGNRVDCIVISNFPVTSPSKSFVYDSENKVLTVNVNKIYERTTEDYKKVQQNCYMLIEENRAYNISNKYPGFKISYVSEYIANNTIPGKR